MIRPPLHILPNGDAIAPETVIRVTACPEEDLPIRQNLDNTPKKILPRMVYEYVCGDRSNVGIIECRTFDDAKGVRDRLVVAVELARLFLVKQIERRQVKSESPVTQSKEPESMSEGNIPAT